MPGNYNVFYKSNTSIVYNWLLAALVLGFVAFKFNDLSLPYFWDELGVYAQCAVYQFHHGISLMPSSLPPELSRGHPLLFTFINACVMKILGTSVFVAHSFQLLVSICLLLVIYRYVSKYFNRLSAFVSVILLTVQPVFLAQSALVLPEVMLSLFVFLSIVNYYEKKYFLFGVFASLAILTKESAIVLPCVALAYSVLLLILGQVKKDAFYPRSIFFTLLPYIVFGVFLLIQKQQNGWFFFPYHIGAVNYSADKVISDFSHFFNFIFWSHGRYWWIKCLLAAAVIALLTNRLNRESLRRNILVLILIFMFAFLLFSAGNFYMERYVLVVIVFASIMMGVSVVGILKNKVLIGIATFLLVWLAAQYTEGNNFNYDSDMGYRRNVDVLARAVDYCADFTQGKKLVDGNFPVYFAINFPEGGYLKKGKPILASVHVEDSIRYFIESKPGDEVTIDRNRFTDSAIATFRNGYAEATVYELKKK